MQLTQGMLHFQKVSKTVNYIYLYIDISKHNILTLLVHSLHTNNVFSLSLAPGLGILWRISSRSFRGRQILAFPLRK